MTNNEIARRLQQHARELTQRRDLLYRIRAYRRAAETLLRCGEPVEALVSEHGNDGLKQLPGIGRRLARTIVRYVRTGEWCPDSLAG